MKSEQYKAGMSNGIKLGTYRERKRIANLFMDQVCADFQIDAICTHTVCAGYFDVASKLNFGEREASIYQCTKCETESTLVIQQRGFCLNGSCSVCGNKMEKEIIDEQV